MNSITTISTAHVDAALHYLVPMPEKPVAYNYQPPPGIPQRTGEYAPHLLPIRDARMLAGRCRWMSRDSCCALTKARFGTSTTR